MTSKWKILLIHTVLLLGLTATGWLTPPIHGASTQEVLCYTERITNAPSFNIYTGRNDPNNPIVWTHTVPAGILNSVVRVGLYIEAWDVDDPPQGDEYDRVYFNGYDLGYLDGDNNTWRTVEKTVPVAALREGLNNLQVYVDELGKDWKVTIRASELRFYCSTPDPDFSIGATPENREITAGESTQYTVNLTGLNGFHAAVNLSVSGLPSGATGVFAVNPLTPSPTAETVLNITSTTAIPTGTYTLAISGVNGDKRHETTVTLKINDIPLPPDFSINATPASQEITAGEAGSYAVNLTGINGFNAAVNLSVTGLPAGVSGVFAVNPLTPAPTASTTLNITSTTATAAGTYTLSISGSNGDLQRGTTVTLIIKNIPPPPGNFDIQVEPTARTVYQGNSTDYQMILKAINSYKETVQLRIKDLPADSSATFSVTSLIPAGQSLLTVTTTDKTPVGEYTLVITATDGTITHVKRVTLKVEAKPLAPEFQITVTPPSRTLYHGETSGFTVGLTPLNGFNQPVELTVSGVPEGCSAGFSESKVTPPNGSQLQLTISETMQVGEYPLLITAKGGGLEHAVTVKLTVVCRDFSVQLETSRTRGPAPLKVQFQATLLRDGLISPDDYRYAWDFGDGTTATEQNPEHTFLTAQVFTVTVTATDRCGIAKSASVTIAPDDFEGVLQKEFSLSEAQPGQELDILLLASNQTRQAFREVTVSDELSPYLIYMRDDAGFAPSRSGNKLVWTLPVLQQNETKTIRVRVKLADTTPEGTISNTAYLAHQSLGTGKSIPSNTAQLTVHHIQVVLQKQVEQTSVLPGGVVKYQVLAQNNSTIPLTGVRIKDELASHLEFMSQTSNDFGFTFSQQGSTLVWTGVLAAQQQVVLHVEARVRANVFSGTRIENTASLEAEKLKQPLNSNTVLTIVTAEPVPTTKVRFNKRCEVPQSEVGRIIRFNVTTTNLSESTLLAPVLEDYMPQGFSYVAGSTLLNGQAFADPQGNRHMTWLLPDIGPGQTTILRYQVVIGADVSRGRNENRATLRTRDNSGQHLFFEDAAFVNVSVAGFVFFSGVEGTVYLDRDDDGFYSGEDTPLDNIEVRLSGGQKAITDRMGRYLFENLFPGEYGLSVNRATIPDKYKVVDPYPVVVTLADGLTDTHDFAIQFQRQDEVGSAKLVGRVFYDKNRNLSYEPDDALAVKFDAKLDGRLLTSGSNGMFVFTHLEPGPHVVEILYDRKVIKKEITLIKGNNTIDIPLLFTGIKIIVSGEEQ